MSNNTQTIYSCNKCGAQFSKWNGRCLECGGWGTLSAGNTGENGEIRAEPAPAIDLDKIKEGGLIRIPTGIGEVDRCLGGGLVRGSLTLISGEPGIGKSTILAQIADAIAGSSGQGGAVYVSGEESAGQVKDRMEGLGCRLGNIKFIGETDVDKVVAGLIDLKPSVAVIDSVQTVYSSELPGEAGGINQIRAAAVKFLEIAKRRNIAVILVGHITKDGGVAGPKQLEHVVDTVIYLESDPARDFRILRATKNRFGSVNELGIFEMTGEGFKEIKNPAGIFLGEGESISGTVISSVMEGTRPFLVEIQALVTKTVFGYPQRKASGFDLNRLQVLSAVLTKRANLNLTNQDVILNVVGGLKISDPGLDLAVCLAISSSLLNQTIDRKTIVLGEVGLGGEVRNVGKLKNRLDEARKLGFTKAIIPDFNVNVKGIELTKVKNLEEIVKKITR